MGDIKYKVATGEGAAVGPNADLYQILAYALAAAVPKGMLIYAAGERDEGTYRVRNSGQVLEIRTMELDAPPRTVLAAIGRLADNIRRQRDGARANEMATAKD